jgi:hypothetical protein
VICIQEDRASNDWRQLRDYTALNQCCTNEALCNTILVHNSIAAYSRVGLMVKMNACTTQRCFCGAHLFGDFQLFNVHMCGGRFDDKDHAANARAKESEAAQMLQYAPDLIVGDFNAEPTEARARQTLARHPTYSKLNSSQKNSYLDYYLSGHKHMQSRGYQPHFPNKSTSEYGGTPDGAYAAPNTSVLSVSVIPGFAFSDHNALVITVRRAQHVPQSPPSSTPSNHSMYSRRASTSRRAAPKRRRRTRKSVSRRTSLKRRRRTRKSVSRRAAPKRWRRTKRSVSRKSARRPRRTTKRLVARRRK